MLCLFVIMGVLASASQISAFTAGSCVTSPVDLAFDANQYIGKWYEIERSNVVFEKDLGCVSAEYGLLNSSAVSVTNSGVNVNTNEPNLALGVAIIPDQNKPNQLKVRFPGSPAPGSYDVWQTDYKTYTLIYSCQQIVPALLKLEMIWILARERTLDAQNLADLKKKLTDVGVSISSFEKTPQTGCDN